MDLVENMKRSRDTGDAFTNEEMFKKMDQIEDEMMNPKEW